jgi:hypothetical protein
MAASLLVLPLQRSLRAVGLLHCWEGDLVDSANFSQVNNRFTARPDGPYEKAVDSRYALRCMPLSVARLWRSHRFARFCTRPFPSEAPPSLAAGRCGQRRPRQPALPQRSPQHCAAATSERVIAKSGLVKEQHMEIASSESEVSVSADMRGDTDTVSEIWYLLGTVLIYGGGVGLVAYFLLM